MSVVNNCQLIGYTGREPDLRYTSSGKAICTFTLATKETWGDKETTWHNLVFWGKLAEVAKEYVKKGSGLAVTGRISHSQYEKDGEKRSKTEIVVDGMRLLDKKPKKEESQGDDENDNDDLPF